MIDRISPRPVRIVALTEAGNELGLLLQSNISNSTLWYKPAYFAEKVQQAFRDGEPLIMICATGIAVRTLAPVLVNKLQDPPVLVMDEQAQYVIPLLSGHEGGANDWAANVAKKIGAQLVMTTAKPYLHPVYTVGMGCEKHCPMDELLHLLQRCLEGAGLELNCVHSINSIELKQHEVGLLELAKKLRLPYQTFCAERLREVESQLSEKSEYVFKTVGVYGVAEAAALVGASQATTEPAELILAKQKTAKATCAIARSYPMMKARNFHDE